MTIMIRKGTEVKWKWGTGFGTGKVIETSDKTMKKNLEGTTVTRHGSTSDLALLIEQEDGSQLLKLQSEVERAD